MRGRSKYVFLHIQTIYSERQIDKNTGIATDVTIPAKYPKGTFFYYSHSIVEGGLELMS